MTMKSIVLVSSLCLFLLAGCAVEGGDYSYGYYTGIKNPHVKRDNTNQTDESSDNASAAMPDKGSSKPTGNYHRVSKGETLYSIAWEYGHDVREVAAWNHIRAPYTIYPNQLIRIVRPKVVARAKTKTAHPTSKDYSYRPPTQPTKTSRTKTSTRAATASAGKISWQWPTKGNIITRYSSRDAGKKGLDIAGKQGQAIYAAAGGEIVYSGSGLRGYGKLIIIKHNDMYLSAYAHNKRLHVKEDQTVKKGQHIADMGSSEADTPMLHFEVRRNGKPVDPLRYLPRRR